LSLCNENGSEIGYLFGQDLGAVTDASGVILRSAGLRNNEVVGLEIAGGDAVYLDTDFGFGSLSVDFRVGSLTSAGNLDAPNFYSGAYSWTPTITALAPMSITGTPTVNYAKYTIMGPWMFIEVDVAFATTGTASNTVYFTVPSGYVRASSYETMAGKYYPNGGSSSVAMIQQGPTTSTFMVRPYDLSNWPIVGTNSNTFTVKGFFRYAAA
jgi:hypothetical protein